tara:strand:+ start:798 stop:1340 length:543 start_codon:yes stop_codon:yes gene_type:complete
MKFKIFKFKKVQSTNSTAINLLKYSKYEYGMVISETQAKGRGQYGKKWVSYKGNLFVSFFYKLEPIKASFEQLTKINCFLVKQVLSFYYKKRIIFKKPNDLLIDKKKICGILQEIISNHGKKYLVVGIGINLKKNPIIKDYPTTNLYNLINKIVPKKKIENDLKKIFEKKVNTLNRVNKK